MRIIGIAGAARTGKSTAAMHLIDSHGFAEYAFAQPIKEMLRAGFGLTDEQLFGAKKEEIIPWLGVSPRRLAQTLGTEWGRQLVADDVWLRLAWQWLGALPRYTPGAVFSDVRFENEAAFIRHHGGTVVHLVRDDAPSVEAHASESGVRPGFRDYQIRNDGSVAELHAKLDDMLRVMAGGDVHAEDD